MAHTNERITELHIIYTKTDGTEFSIKVDSAVEAYKQGRRAVAELDDIVSFRTSYTRKA